MTHYSNIANSTEYIETDRSQMSSRFTRLELSRLTWLAVAEAVGDEGDSVLEPGVATEPETMSDDETAAVLLASWV